MRATRTRDVGAVDRFDRCEFFRHRFDSRFDRRNNYGWGRHDRRGRNERRADGRRGRGTGAGQILAGDPVMVGIEAIWISGKQMVLGFSLISKVRAVVIERAGLTRSVRGETA
jgi:hypothetical protein